MYNNTNIFTCWERHCNKYILQFAATCWKQDCMGSFSSLGHCCQGCWGQQRGEWSARTACTETSSLTRAACSHLIQDCSPGIREMYYFWEMVSLVQNLSKIFKHGVTNHFISGYESVDTKTCLRQTSVSHSSIYYCYVTFSLSFSHLVLIWF